MAVLNMNTYETSFAKKQSVFVSGRKFHSLSFRSKGRVSFTDNCGKTFISEAPCITYIPQGMSYSTEILESGEMTVVHFIMNQELFGNEPKVFDVAENSAFHVLFRSLSKNQNRGKPENYSAFSTFYEILSLLSEMEQQKIPVKMRRTKSFIDENFANLNLSVSELSKNLNISEVYLRREFKKHFGMSPLSYINKIRISTAKAMLKTDYYTISQISELCGFLSLSYFSFAFHKATGFSPTEYSKRFL